MIEIFDNIRKIYTFSDACPELADHIEFFSESSIESTQQYFGSSNFSVKMFPSWTPTFYINLGAPYLIRVGQQQHHVKASQDILILRNSIVERYNSPSDNIFTVKFYPGGLEAVLDVSQLKCVDRMIDLATILPSKLLGQIKQPLSFIERCDLMQQFLLNSFKEGQQKDYYLQFVRDCIGSYGTAMQMNTSEMAEKMFVSSKTINRYFNRVVGVSPKNYFSVMRARFALTHYVNNRKDFIPYDFGYYDMSHFYKEVVRFTGKKLTEHAA
jgi:AraC-like DNA-binding protein